MTRLHSPLVLACLVACALGFAPAPVYREPKPARPRSDEQGLQGAWEAVSLSLEGDESRVRPGSETAVFAGGRMSRLLARKVTAEWAVTLDPAARPKSLDLRNPKGDHIQCIYRLEGDRLAICWRNSGGGPRPVEFKGGPGIGLEILRRVKGGR